MAKYRIAVMQRAVAEALQKADELDPPAESDTIDALDNFLRSQGVPDQEIARTKKLLFSRITMDALAKRLTHCQIRIKEIAMKRKESKIKQQAWNREQSVWAQTQKKSGQR